MAVLIKAFSKHPLDNVKFDAIELYCNLRQYDIVIDSHVFGFTDPDKPFYYEKSVLINMDYSVCRDDLKSFVTCLRLNYPDVRFGGLDLV